MFESIRSLSVFIGCLMLVLTFADSVAAQKRRKVAAKKPVVEIVTDEEKAATLENLQGAKVFQLLAELQLGLAEAYLENRDSGEAKANLAYKKLMLEKIKNPSSLFTIFTLARGNAIWIDYLLDRNGYGKDAKSDKQVKFFHDGIRRDVEDGLAVKADSAHIIAVRGNLREFDCRLNLKTSAADCYDLPLADLSRAIALQPDEYDFFSLRAEFFERQKETELAAHDREIARMIGEAMELNLDLNKTATARRPLNAERASAETVYFMAAISMLQDKSVKAQLAADAWMLKSYREKLLNYYRLADDNYGRANVPKPSAAYLQRRGMLRYHLGTFAEHLGFEQPSEFARKNFDEAVAFYTGAIKLDADFAEAYEDRARVYRKLGKIDLADADQKQFDLLKEKTK